MTPVASSEAAVWRWFGRQLALPSGRAGQMVGGLMWLLNRAPYARALAALEAEAGQRVLEIGYGPGAGIAALLGSGARVYGLDAAPAMNAAAVRRNGAAVRAGKADLRVGRADAIPWPDGHFDRVLAVNVAYFLKPDALAEIRRVLAPGGRLVLYATARVTMERWPFAGPETHHTFDAPGLRALIAGGGFPETAITVREEKLPLGIMGLVATARQA